jgi:response regulator of citrate/malate metabolism
METQVLAHVMKEAKLKTRVLIIEDDPTIAPMWTYILGKVDPELEIVWATSDAEGERFIQNSIKYQNEFDLIISDIFLSGPKTGIDLWFRYREYLEGKFILTSGITYRKYLQHMEKSKSIFLPFYLQKPLDATLTSKAVYFALQSKFN